MKYYLFAVILPGVMELAAFAVLVFWIHTEPAVDLVLRTPGLDREGIQLTTETRERVEPGEPVVSSGKPSNLPGEWPCFRGPNRDGISDDDLPLARSWPEEGPPVLWTVDLGPGHAGAAVSGGRVYVLDYDVEAEADTLRCLSLDDGREMWHVAYPVVIKDSHGMSRTVPAVADGCVVSFGPKGHVFCWDAETGKPLWGVDLVLDYGATTPEWYAAQCPLIDQGRVILAPSGAETLMIAVDLKGGEVVWQTETPPELANWLMTHVSIAPVEIADRRMYVYCGTYGVTGVAADDGSLLWHSTD
ncbi:MAG: outer membrane protein assembly factor BamB family protein, partial [Planctomycetota bacterium]